jgi:rhamnulokinase
MSAPVFAAVDLGATSGRVVAGRFTGRGFDLDVVHRFANVPVERAGHLRWDVQRLFDEVLAGLEWLAERYPNVVSIGIDSWGVDYGLLDRGGELLADPVSYRAPRTAKAVERVHAALPPDALYRINGVQHLPFNTVYQLATDRTRPQWDEVAHVVLLPDLIAYWLTGELATEATIASTTGLVDVRTGTWSHAVLDAAAVDAALLPPIVRPGTLRGPVRPELCRRLGLPVTTVVTNVGAHDTASAVAAVPAADERFAYVSSGTWSLVGVELGEPNVTDAARAANFTNERAVDGGIRFLRNVGGLWLLEECLRAWAAAGEAHDLDELLRRAGAVGDSGARIDVDAPELLAPGDMPARIAAAVAGHGGRAPTDAAETTRCILDSLAERIGSTVADARRLSDIEVDVLHVVGGGSQNELLCRLAATAAGRPVIAGPVEATALGNLAAQARAHDVMPGTWSDARRTVARSELLRRYEPNGVGAGR